LNEKNPETIETLRSPRLIEAQQRHIDRLSALFDGQALSQPFLLQGIVGEGQADPCKEPELWVEEVLDSLAAQGHVLLDRKVYRPLIVMFRPYRLYFIEALFGARTEIVDGQWWAHPLGVPIGGIERPDLKTNAAWKQFRRVAEAFASHKTTIPMFSMPTIQGALNTAINLHGGEFLAAMLAEPEASRRDLETINATMCEICRWYRKTIPANQLQGTLAESRCQPPGCGQVYGCSTEMISPDLYRDMIAPLDDRLLSVFPKGGMIHLCGNHTRHIPAWCEMKSLKAVQINGIAANDFETYYEELRSDQIIYLTECTQSDVEKALKTTGGKRIVFSQNEPR